jgi:hypothetical protein
VIVGSRATLGRVTLSIANGADDAPRVEPVESVEPAEAGVAVRRGSLPLVLGPAPCDCATR